jgi:hypothetical protein
MDNNQVWFKINEMDYIQWLMIPTIIMINTLMDPNKIKWI